MAEMTREQRHFLAHHKIPLSDVFDAAGMKRGEYQAIMERLGKKIAYGVSACSAGGHTMRTKHGHCVHCNPAALAFQGRYERDAFVYLAASTSTKILKVGYADDVQGRVHHLNEVGYGSLADWEWLMYFKCNKAGRVEASAQKLLEPLRVSRSYKIWNGKAVECFELFQCNYAQAREAIRASSSVDDFDKARENTARAARYI